VHVDAEISGGTVNYVTVTDLPRVDEACVQVLELADVERSAIWVSVEVRNRLHAPDLNEPAAAIAPRN